MTKILRDSTLGAAMWLIQVYRGRGIDAYETRRRLVKNMDASRRAQIMTATQYDWAAQHYEEAIHIVYGVKLTFPRAVD